MDPWIAEWYIPTHKNSLVDEIVAISSQKLLHGEAAFHPVLTVQMIIEILPDLPRNS